MGVLDRLRAWIWRVEEASNKLEYTVLDEVHRAEEAIDERTGGKFSDVAERASEESEELLERLHLDDDASGGGGRG